MRGSKFSIRDFLWTAAVLGLALGWARDRVESRRRPEMARRVFDEAKADLRQAQIEVYKLQLKIELERLRPQLEELAKAAHEARRNSGGGLKTELMVNQQRSEVTHGQP
jgi:hypothetical protein